MTTPASKKRKTLHDYFDQKSLVPAVQNRLSTPVELPIPGLALILDFITADEEAALLKFLETQKWRTDLRRRCIHYGGTYCLMPSRDVSVEERQRIESTILEADPVPAELGFVVDRMLEHGLYQEKNNPTFCIVNEYVGLQGISAHVENFRFDSPVCGLTLHNGDAMRFHELARADDASVRSGGASKIPRTGRMRDVWLPPRSLLVMKDEVRMKWQHEIRCVRRALGFRRVSLTFRTERSRSHQQLPSKGKAVQRSRLD
jgi:alkylated DNA repair protein alkB family protein 8